MLVGRYEGYTHLHDTLDNSGLLSSALDSVRLALSQESRLAGTLVATRGYIPDEVIPYAKMVIVWGQ